MSKSRHRDEKVKTGSDWPLHSSQQVRPRAMRISARPWDSFSTLTTHNLQSPRPSLPARILFSTPLRSHPQRRSKTISFADPCFIASNPSYILSVNRESTTHTYHSILLVFFAADTTRLPRHHGRCSFDRHLAWHVGDQLLPPRPHELDRNHCLLRGFDSRHRGSAHVRRRPSGMYQPPDTCRQEQRWRRWR